MKTTLDQSIELITEAMFRYAKETHDIGRTLHSSYSDVVERLKKLKELAILPTTDIYSDIGTRVELRLIQEKLKDLL